MRQKQQRLGKTLTTKINQMARMKDRKRRTDT